MPHETQLTWQSWLKVIIACIQYYHWLATWIIGWMRIFINLSYRIHVDYLRFCFHLCGEVAEHVQIR